MGIHRAVGFSGTVESGSHGDVIFSRLLRDLIGKGVPDVEGEQRHMVLVVGARRVAFNTAASEESRRKPW